MTPRQPMTREVSSVDALRLAVDTPKEETPEESMRRLLDGIARLEAAIARAETKR